MTEKVAPLNVEAKFSGTVMRPKGYTAIGNKHEPTNPAVIGAHSSTHNMAMVASSNGCGLYANDTEEPVLWYSNNPNNDKSYLSLGSDNTKHDCYVYFKASGVPHHTYESDFYLRATVFGQGESAAHQMYFSGGEFLPVKGGTGGNGTMLGGRLNRWDEIFSHKPLNTDPARMETKFAKARSSDKDMARKLKACLGRYRTEDGKVTYGVRAEDVLAIFEEFGATQASHGIITGDTETGYGVCLTDLHSFIMMNMEV